MPAGSSDFTNFQNGSKRDILETASKTVDHLMLSDGSYSELVDCLKMGGNFPSESGLNDHDYPGASELGISFHSLAQLNVSKKIPLPPELVEQLDWMQMERQLGLFPEIGRAWLTVDSNVFFWSFYDGSDLAYYDELSDAILSVGLAKAKPGVFQSFIHYLLCLATPLEIVILGVNFGQRNENSSPHEEMHLLPDPLFRFATDNIIMPCFGATDSGRIFLGGRDGCIYEFTYQAAEGWFRRKCRKINHGSSAFSFLVPAFFQVFSKQDAIAQISVDNSRNILYVLSESGTVQVFDLGSDGSTMKRIASLSQQCIISRASRVAVTIDPKHFSPIVHISAIESSESKQVNLVAITSTGVRLYFSTNLDATSIRPCTLSLLHVRMPPGYTANSIGDKPSNVHHALYHKGFLMLACSVIEDHDFLFTTCSDSFLTSNKLVETNAGLSLDGHVWALAEIPSTSTTKSVYEKSSSEVASTTDPPSLITQHSENPRQFVVLSTQGTSILTKPRPVDQFRRLLLASKGCDNETVNAFFRIHGEAQACAMCLILACDQTPQNQQVSEWATRAFFVHGNINVQSMNTMAAGEGDSGLDTLSVIEPSRAPAWASTPAQREISQLRGVYSPVRPAMSPARNTSILSPSFNQPVNLQSENPGLRSEISFSSKHDGLYLYYSRIMRPLWNMKIIIREEIPFHSPAKFVTYSTVPGKDLTEFYMQLKALKDFMQRHYGYFNNTANGRVMNASNMSIQRTSALQEMTTVGAQQPTATQIVDAEVQERTSLQNLQFIVSQSCEVLGLWKILCDHQIDVIFNLLSLSLQEQLQQMTFKDFIVDGLVLCGFLSSALISYYLEDDSDTSSVSNKLREVCPTIYKAEDAVISKAQEMVLNSRTIINAFERNKELTEALKLCKSVCASLDVEDMCSLFKGSNFYLGIVDLCLTTAQKIDPQKLALHYYKNGKPANDQQGQEIFLHRERIYKIILDTIGDLMTKSARSKPQAQLNTSSSFTEQPPPQQQTLSPEDARKFGETMFAAAIKTDDELFHSTFYDWLIENQHTDSLLTIKSLFLEEYLKRRTLMNQDCTYSLDLLWKFYEKNDNFSAAARVLAKMVDKNGTDLNLIKRIEYLSRSIMCLRSSEMRSSAAAGEGEFLYELEEKMEVARIQLQILEILQHKTVPGVQDSIAKLNSNLMDITELYEGYAVPYDLPEIKLAIIRCADHHDTNLVESLWQSIIDKEFRASCGTSLEARVNIIQQKIESFSQTYMKTAKYFPIAFIVKYLEYKSCSLNCQLQWVYEMFLRIGVPMPDLINTYNKMYRSKDVCWMMARKPFHLLQVLCLLIGELINNPSCVSQNERKGLVILCLDFIAGYLVDLQATTSAIDVTVTSLIKDFKIVQHSLERLTL